MCFSAGQHYPFILPFGKIRIYGDIKTFFLGKVRIKPHRFLSFWTFLLGKLINSVDPQGNRAFVSSSGNNCGNICQYAYHE